MRIINDVFNDKQLDRYAEYKKSTIEKSKNSKSTSKIENPRIKKIIQSILGENVPVSNQIQIIMQGIAKIHAGELVEEAKKLLYEESVENIVYSYIDCDDKGNCGKLHSSHMIDIKAKPIRPKHLREARRRMVVRGKMPDFKVKDPLD